MKGQCKRCGKKGEVREIDVWDDDDRGGSADVEDVGDLCLECVKELKKWMKKKVEVL